MFSGVYNPEVVLWLAQQVSKAIIDAVNDLQPGKMGIGNFHARDFVRNRLVGEDGSVNDDFLMIIASQNDGRKAILGSFDAHATTLGDWNMETSADYPGYWQRKLEKQGFGMAVFFAGSVGSHSYQSKGERFEKSRYIGEALADSVLKYSSEIDLKDTITLNSLTLKIDYPEFQIRISDGLRLNPTFAGLLFPEVGHVYLQSFRLDDLIWTTTPSDFSGETALIYKNAMHQKGYRAMVTSFNGAYTGYIIPCKYYHLNEYESRLMNWFGPGYNPYINYMIGEMIKRVSG
jgi:neutral ceramidase